LEGGVILERGLLWEERCWFGFFSRHLAFGFFGLLEWEVKVRGRSVEHGILPWVANGIRKARCLEDALKGGMGELSTAISRARGYRDFIHTGNPIQGIQYRRT